MSLRTSLSRLTRRDPEAPTLRERLSATAERLAATKERAGRAAKVAKILMKPPEPVAPPVDRLALINYATWLAHERRLLCHELYPHSGQRADRFIVANVAADDFHFPYDNRTWRDVPPPSTRAVSTLDRLGIDWRADTARRDWHDPPVSRPENDDRPIEPVPHGWPRTDAALLEALDDLTRLDAAVAAMHTGGDRDADTVPGYEALEAARDDALDRLADERAESLIGLQAKARAILTPSVTDIDGAGDAIAQSLARNLLGLRQSAIEPKPDPIFAAIEENRRLDAIRDELRATAAHLPDGAPEWEREHEAYRALWGHWRDTLLKTVPTTPRGCAALARYAGEFLTAQGVDEGRDAVLALIARSPLL